MTPLLIDNDVPPPIPGTRASNFGARGSIFHTLREMAVGQSFHVDCDKSGSSAARAFARLHAKKLNIKITSSYVGEHDPRGPGLRVWRLS